MALTVRSIATNNSGTASNTVTVTKPTGLAVGDLMVAAVCFRGSQSHVQPSGWTQIRQQYNPGNAHNTTTWYKVATSDDVAAADFTWTKSGGAAQITFAGIIAFSGGFDPDDVINAQNGQANAAGSTATPAITPDEANCTIFYALYQSDEDGATSAYQIATSDPGGWTQAFELATGSSNSMLTMAYSAPRPETTSTGAASCTTANANDNAAIVFAVNEGPPAATGSPIHAYAQQ